MNVSYIEEIYNNTKHKFAMWSTDSDHNGIFHDRDSKKQIGDNDWGHVLIIQPSAKIKADWCGIPWYKNGSTYRVIAKADKQVDYGLRLHQSETDEGDGIHFIDFKTGHPVGVVPFKQDGDRQFTLTIDEGKDGQLEFKLWNAQTKTGKQDFVKALEKFAQDYYDDVREIRVELGKAVVGALVSGG